jgi:hypothetical protein
MLSLMHDIVARQKRDRDLRLILGKIHEGEQYFFDVELTQEQAESLGWRKTEALETLAGAL